MHQLQARNALVQDLLQYCRPIARRHGSSGEISDTSYENSLPFVSSSGFAIPQGGAPKGLTVGHDPTLTSLAQLGCFLLDCEKSFIFILDNESQYVISEATKKASLLDPIQAQPDDVPTGAQILDLFWDISLRALHTFTAIDDKQNECNKNVTLNHDIHIINDISQVEGLKDRPFIRGSPHLKFYAAVPITSQTGVIGVYCVVDNKERHGLDQKGTASLNELASTIVQHLELLKNQHDLQRARGMVQGLGLFVEGKNGWEDNKRAGQLQLRETSATRSQSQDKHEDHEDHIFHSRAAHTSLEQSTSIILPSASGPRASTAKRTTSNTSLGPRERKLSVDGTAFRSIAPPETMELFSRASNLIRQAMGVDGTMFIDGGFSDSTMESFHPVSSTPSPETSPPRTVKGSTPNAARHLTSSDLLGYSTSDHFDLESTRRLSQQGTLPRATLRLLLRDHWQGLIFFFNDDGTLLGVSKPGEIIIDGSTDTLRDFQKHEGKQEWVRQILDICPGARTVIFFPLWDPQQDRWSIGGLAWSNSSASSARVLQADDITYLKAFGHCIMAEKFKLDAITADRAKANFISSVSHELRTPLHGVLASAEALQETSANFTQDDLIRTITVCGEVLLDTTDQILDYAKTHKSSNSTLSGICWDSPSPTDNLAGQVSSLNLSSLVEAVVEGIFAGHIHRELSPGHSDPSRSSSSHDSISIAASLAEIMVIISIKWENSWAFETHAGGWKRIVMNLFGNAMKFTGSGFVHVSLRVDCPPTPESPSRSIVTLQVEDSGKGMSKYFQKHRVYCPFAQEDPMSVGTGLGLSIVRQLVTELGGTIRIQSEEGCGTTVQVTAPVEPSSEATLFPDIDSLTSQMKSRCQGLTICLIGFEDHPSDEGQGRPMHTKRASILKNSLEIYSADWFGMNITNASSLKVAKGDVLLGLQSRLDLGSLRTDLPPLLIFEDDPFDARFRDKKGITVLTQPVGPQKLARVLDICLHQREAAREPSGVRKISGPETPGAEGILPRDMTGDVSKSAGSPYELVCEQDPSKIREEIYPVAGVSSPVEPPPSRADESKQTSETKVPGRSRVLLVEDSATNLTILSRFMERGHEQYVTATDGLEAFEKYAHDPESFKVIFMDIAMPVMDGLSSTRKIRDFETQNSSPRTRIVALTCFSSAEAQSEAFLSGMDMFLIKPVPMKALKPILDMDPENFPSS